MVYIQTLINMLKIKFKLNLFCQAILKYIEPPFSFSTKKTQHIIIEQWTAIHLRIRFKFLLGFDRTVKIKVSSRLVRMKSSWRNISSLLIKYSILHPPKRIFFIL